MHGLSSEVTLEVSTVTEHSSALARQSRRLSESQVQLGQERSAQEGGLEHRGWCLLRGHHLLHSLASGSFGKAQN